MSNDDYLYAALRNSVALLREAHQKPAYYRSGCRVCAAIVELEEEIRDIVKEPPPAPCRKIMQNGV